MAFKPNYNQDRMERDRRARLKKDEKQQERETKSAQRKVEQEAKSVASLKDTQS